jgi:hypothetical protein
MFHSTRIQQAAGQLGFRPVVLTASLCFACCDTSSSRWQGQQTRLAHDVLAVGMTLDLVSFARDLGRVGPSQIVMLFNPPKCRSSEENFIRAHPASDLH